MLSPRCIRWCFARGSISNVMSIIPIVYDAYELLLIRRLTILWLEGHVVFRSNAAPNYLWQCMQDAPPRHSAKTPSKSMHRSLFLITSNFDQDAEDQWRYAVKTLCLTRKSEDKWQKNTNFAVFIQYFSVVPSARGSNEPACLPSLLSQSSGWPSLPHARHLIPLSTYCFFYFSSRLHHSSFS